MQQEERRVLADSESDDEDDLIEEVQSNSKNVGLVKGNTRTGIKEIVEDNSHVEKVCYSRIMI